MDLLIVLVYLFIVFMIWMWLKWFSGFVNIYIYFFRSCIIWFFYDIFVIIGIWFDDIISKFF